MPDYRAFPMGSRSYKDRDLKRLFALSRNVCAFPGCDQRLADPAWPSVQAEICHIAGLQEGSARFDPSMTDEERNAFENLLLLCPNHHRFIDALEPDRWPIDRLLELKMEHERVRSGDQPIDPDLVAHAVVALVVQGGLEVEDLGEMRHDMRRDPESEWLDPSSGVRAMLSAIARAGQIEARHFGEATPFDANRGWTDIGFATQDYFDVLIGRAVVVPIPPDDLRELRDLRDEASNAFGRIPGC